MERNIPEKMLEREFEAGEKVRISNSEEVFFVSRDSPKAFANVLLVTPENFDHEKERGKKHFDAKVRKNLVSKVED